eukprot:3240626-Rhodomonas_salina.3
MASSAKPEEVDPEDKKKGQQDKWKNFSLTSPDLWIAIFVIIAVIVVGWFFGNAIFQFIIDAKDWFREELPFSLIIYYIFFCLCALVFIPYGPFCIAIGFVFGLQWGFAIQMVAIFLSSSVLFAFGRFILKDKVHEIIAKTDGATVWKGLMKYMGKDWKEVNKRTPHAAHLCSHALSDSCLLLHHQQTDAPTCVHLRSGLTLDIITVSHRCRPFPLPACSRQAAKINILLCFMPVPYGSHPYLFSMTTIPFGQFVLFFMM